jgi:hypothetical protein
MSFELVVTALPLDRADECMYMRTHGHAYTRLRACVLMCGVFTLGRLLPDTKFVPTAHERLPACPWAAETILELWSGRGAVKDQ